MNESSQTTSEGRAQTIRGSGFEALVHSELQSLFKRVDIHAKVKGHSGINWTVDALVNGSLIVEASVQKRLETKIDSTFLRFVDITRLNQNIKAALVFESMYVGFHRTLGKKFFPTSEYRTMIEHGFPILTPGAIPRLVEFFNGEKSASEISSKPLDFNARSLSSSRYRLGQGILVALTSGPASRRELAKALAVGPYAIDDAVKSVSVAKISSYYALDANQIYRRLAQRGRNTSHHQRELVLEWLRNQFLQRVTNDGHYRTRDFARDNGLAENSLTHFVHDLSKDGIIRRFGKGDWSLANPEGQRKLAL